MHGRAVEAGAVETVAGGEAMTGSDDWKVKLQLDGGGEKFYTVSGRVTAVISTEEFRAALYRVADEIVRQLEEQRT